MESKILTMTIAEPTYPCLMIYEEKGLVVLFTAPDEGTVVIQEKVGGILENTLQHGIHQISNHSQES